MKILYDHQMFTRQKFGGISRYFYELMAHSRLLFEYEVGGIFSENEYIKKLGLYKEFPIKAKFKGKNRIISFLNKRDSIKKMNGTCDIVHPTYYDSYFLQKNKKPLVVTVHDMIHELFPQYFPNDTTTIQNKKLLLSKADKIIAISESTKKDILAIYPDIPQEKISVIYHGTSYKISTEEKKENYILFTGDRGNNYKNFKIFIEAAAPLLTQYNLSLICTGLPFNADEISLLKNLNIADKATSIYASEDELPSIYAKAIAFVYPSLYEGFGIPILEAFAAGCPAVLSNTSSLPEVAGDAAVYFDPKSVKEMRSAIDRVISSQTLQQQLIAAGRERLSRFSWDKCAKETAAVYGEM